MSKLIVLSLHTIPSVSIAERDRLKVGGFIMALLQVCNTTAWHATAVYSHLVLNTSLLPQQVAPQLAARTFDRAGRQLL